MHGDSFRCNFTSFATELGYDFVNAYDGTTTDSSALHRRLVFHTEFHSVCPNLAC